VAYSLGLVLVTTHFVPKYAAFFNLPSYTTFGYISNPPCEITFPFSAGSGFSGDFPFEFCYLTKRLFWIYEDKSPAYIGENLNKTR